jgi:hypothetical protein
MSEIRTAFLFTVTITVAPAQIVRATPIGERRNVPVTGGTFGGKRLRCRTARTGSSSAAMASGNSMSGCHCRPMTGRSST